MELYTKITSVDFDIVVIGDEIESVLTAISAGRLGGSSGVTVALCRRSTGLLGGLSTRGGLSYMDITPEFTAPLFQEFLDKAGVVRVALNPSDADCVLNEMLVESGVKVFNGVNVDVKFDDVKDIFNIIMGGNTLTSRIVIDATPDADVARALKVPYITGLGGLLKRFDDTMSDFLGVSPVFTINNVTVKELAQFEEKLRHQDGMLKKLKEALPYHPEGFCETLINRPTFAPDDMDYLDILNHTIGVAYHHWRYGGEISYAESSVAIDGANISRLKDGKLGFNGLVATVDDSKNVFETLLDYSHGGKIPDFLIKEMNCFEQFLKEEGGFDEVEICPPEELYVRQTCTLLARENMTARMMLRGGVAKEKAIGTSSYWLDMRGVNLYQIDASLTLPKPVFNAGLEVCLPLCPQLENFAFVSRSAGYSPLAQGAGRIVQHNAMLGEALGVAATLAVLNHERLNTQVVYGLKQVQDIVAHRRGGELQAEGGCVLDKNKTSDALEQLLTHDENIVAELREELTQREIFV